MIPCVACQRMTRNDGACDHCAAPLSMPRRRSELSLAAAALGLVTLAGCEWFDSAQHNVAQYLGFESEEPDTPVPDADPDLRDMAPAYGVPSVDTGGPPPPPPSAEAEPQTNEPKELSRDQPLYGVP